MQPTHFRLLSLKKATDRPPCEKCGAATTLIGVTQKKDDADLCTFECTKCNCIETFYVSYDE